MIQVCKRNGQYEEFNPDKLRLAIWRAMSGDWQYFMAAHHFSRAIEIYLARRRMDEVSSGALFEMAVLTLSRAGCDDAATCLSEHRSNRLDARKRTVVLTAEGRELPWSRDRLTAGIMLRWSISEQAARVISSELELSTINNLDCLDEEALLDAADELVENFGLAPWCLMSTLPGGNES